jgi:hypothetical protein
MLFEAAIEVFLDPSRIEESDVHGESGRALCSGVI